MKTRTVSMREKIIASAASAALAASMVVCVPGMAFATYDTGSITPVSTSLEVVAGSQTDLSKFFSYKTTGGDGVCHVDYKITGGSGATVNKHSGILTATSAGDVTVTAYLTGIAQPAKEPNNPCNSTEAKVSSSISVKINSTSTYGFQGIGGNAIKMTSTAVDSVAGNDAEGWTNYLAASTPIDGYYHFTIQMTNGFKDHNTPLAFAERNKNNIVLKDSDGEIIDTLSAKNNTGVKIDAVDSGSKTISVSVSTALVTSGNTRLVFESGFVGNNDKNTLGIPVAFVIR